MLSNKQNSVKMLGNKHHHCYSVCKGSNA